MLQNSNFIIKTGYEQYKQPTQQETFANLCMETN